MTKPTPIQEKLEKFRKAQASKSSKSEQDLSAHKINVPPEQQKADQSQPDKAPAPTGFTPTEEMKKLQGFDADKFMTRLKDLRTGMEKQAPGITSYLSDILKNLNQYPELVYILPDEKIKIITQALFSITNTEMANIASSSKSKKTLSEQECDTLF